MWPPVSIQSCKHCGASSPIYCDCVSVPEIPYASVREWLELQLAMQKRSSERRQEIRDKRLRDERETPLKDTLAHIKISDWETKTQVLEMRKVREWIRLGYETWGEIDDVRCLLVALSAPAYLAMVFKNNRKHIQGIL